MTEGIALHTVLQSKSIDRAGPKTPNQDRRRAWLVPFTLVSGAAAVVALSTAAPAIWSAVVAVGLVLLIFAVLVAYIIKRPRLTKLFNPFALPDRVRSGDSDRPVRVQDRVIAEKVGVEMVSIICAMLATVAVPGFARPGLSPTGTLVMETMAVLGAALGMLTGHKVTRELRGLLEEQYRAEYERNLCSGTE